MDSILLAFVPFLAGGGYAASHVARKRRDLREQRKRIAELATAKGAGFLWGYEAAVWAFREAEKAAAARETHPTASEWRDAIDYGGTLRRRREAERAYVEAGGVDLRQYVDNYRV